MSIKVVFQHMSEIRGKIYAHVCVCIHIYALACFYQYNKIVLYKVHPIYNITYLLFKQWLKYI